MNSGHIFLIMENSQVGEARRHAQARAERLGFDETARGRVALLINEAGHNLLKHAGGGEIIVQDVHKKGRTGLEILAIDRGPGMDDVKACLQDGYSTAGTQGTGLGALSRVADEFAIFSEPGRGVILLARVWSKSLLKCEEEFDAYGTISLPYPGELVSGDACIGFSDSSRSLYMMADGLGHGPDAAQASGEAVRILSENRQLRPKAILETLHLGLKKTRGAAIAVAEIDHEKACITYAGVGNIAARILIDDHCQGLVSHDGTVGYLRPRIHEYTYPWHARHMLIMHSDGISSRSFPQLSSLITAHDPVMIAGMVMRDGKRARDDQTILVVKAHQ